jgi:hypothetical protein
MSINNNNIPYNIKIHDQLYSKLNNNDDLNNNDNVNDNNSIRKCSFFKKPSPIMVMVPFFVYFLSGIFSY